MCIRDSFLDECCERGDDMNARSGELYTTYRTLSASIGEYVRSTTDFYAALGLEGLKRTKTRLGSIVSGIRILPRNDPKDEFPDFLV